jgi:hypothetical protein
MRGGVQQRRFLETETSRDEDARQGTPLDRQTIAQLTPMRDIPTLWGHWQELRAGPEWF